MLILYFVSNTLDMRGLSRVFGNISTSRRFIPILVVFSCLGFLLGSNVVFGQNSEVPKSGWGAASNGAVTKSSADPQTGYPIFQDNGDPVADNADYAKRKAAWIEANPVAYKKMIEDSKATQIKQIPREEFDRMPQEKKDHILSSPKDYKVVDRSLDNH